MATKLEAFSNVSADPLDAVAASSTGQTMSAAREEIAPALRAGMGHPGRSNPKWPETLKLGFVARDKTMADTAIKSPGGCKLDPSCADRMVACAHGHDASHAMRARHAASRGPAAARGERALNDACRRAEKAADAQFEYIRRVCNAAPSPCNCCPADAPPRARVWPPTLHPPASSRLRHALAQWRTQAGDTQTLADEGRALSWARRRRSACLPRSVWRACSKEPLWNPTAASQNTSGRPCCVPSQTSRPLPRSI